MEKLTLKQKILNKIDDSPRGYSEELAKISHYSSGSSLKKILRDETKEFDKFNGLVEMVGHLFGEDENKLLSQYSKEIDPNNKSARIMLEYLCNNRLLDDMKELINKMEQCKNKESREWAKVYSVNLNYQLNYYDINGNDYLDDIRSCKTSVPELRIYLKILRCHALYMKKAHSMTLELSHEIIAEIDDVKDEYLREVYETKLNEILSYIYLRAQNNPTESRNYALKVLNSKIGLTHKAYAHYTIGCTFMFTSYDQSKENFSSSIELYKKINREKAATDIEEISELLDVIWDKEITNVKYSETYRYYWILKNKLNYNIELNKEKMDLTCYYLLKGMKEDSTEILMQSLIQFVKRGDAFFANLPKIELLKRGYSQVIIDELIHFYK